MNISQQAIGSEFDGFLSDEGILPEVEALTTKKVLAYQIEQAMEQANITKTEMAQRMNTSRSSLNRLLDPSNASVSLLTIESAVKALGKRLEVRVV